MDFAMLIRLLLRLSIMLTVFGLSLRADPGAAVYLFRRPRQLARSLLAMNVVMPLVAVVIALAAPSRLHAAVKICLVTLAVSPVPPILPGRELKAGGHAHYTIGLFVAVGLLSIVFVPVAVALGGQVFGRAVEVPVASVASLVTLTVLAPLAAGLLVHHVAPSLAERGAGPISSVASTLLLVALLPALVVTGPAIVSLIGNGTLAAMALFCAAGLAAGHVLGGPSPPERLVLAMATCSRHPGVAATIAAATIPDEKLTIPAIALYLIVSGIGTALYVAWVRRRSTAARGAEPATSKRSAA
jgi:BASS family bile acid:Na+ symporter